MKISKLISFLCAFLLLFAAVVPASAASFVENGDYKYEIVGGGYLIYSYNGNETSLTLPSTLYDMPVLGISDDCFSGSVVKSVEIPDGYTTIGQRAFYNSSLTEVNIPSTIESIGIMAFSNCSALSNVEISADCALTFIPYAAFQNCTALKSFEIPDSVATISANAFFGTGLTSVVMPDSVTAIGDYVFSNCADLAAVELSNSITALPRYAFSNCTSLSEIFLSDNITSIGEGCFYPNDTITINCFDGSYVDEYCKENSIETVTEEKLFGDVNNDGDVNILDVTLIQKYRIGKYEIGSNKARLLADVNCDNEITIRDATLIQMHIAHKLTDF